VEESIMAVDLLNQVQTHFDASAVRDLGVVLDEQPDRVEQTLSLGAATILAGLARAARSPQEAGRLVDVLKNEPAAASGPGPAPREGSPEAIARRGEPLLRSIFGDRLGGVIDLIADDSGAKSTSVAALLGALAPAISGLIRESLGGRGLDPDALRGLMADQADAVARRAPGGLADVLGVRSLTDFESDAPAAPSRGRRAEWIASARARPRSHWVASIAIGLLALVVGFLMLPRKIDPDASSELASAPATNRPATELARETREAPPAVPADPVSAEGRPLVETAAHRVSLALPGDVKLEVPAGSYLEGMVRALREGKPAESRSFVAGELTFDGDGSLTPEAEASIAQLARVVQAFPDVKLRVDGRQTLKDVDREKARESALRRAEAVREALVRAGVPADRVVAGTVAADLPAEHPAAVAESDVPISIALLAE
jgi:outer membrane protein OmpA-like peptidoglycan-associated protein